MRKVQKPDKDLDRIRDYIALNKALKRVIDSQLNDEPEDNIKASQSELNRIYDEFSKVWICKWTEKHKTFIGGQ